MPPKFFMKEPGAKNALLIDRVRMYSSTSAFALKWSTCWYLPSEILPTCGSVLKMKYSSPTVRVGPSGHGRNGSIHCWSENLLARIRPGERNVGRPLAVEC